MRKQIYSIILLIGFSSISLWSQVPAPFPKACMSTPLSRSIQQKFPLYHQQLEHLYQEALDANLTASIRTEEEIYFIPVVVHVVWKEVEENISDEQIKDQIAVLNEDFRRTNKNASDLRDEFRSVAGDAKIEFELIEIVRVQTDQSFSIDFDLNTFEFTYPDHVKDPNRGGSAAWDVNSYLNIWVCGISEDQFFGYAYPPPSLTNWPNELKAPRAGYDGLVINYKVFGRDLPPFIDLEGNLIPLNGRTTTHEIGHYFGLRHPWGDGGPDIRGCEIDDGLPDTPNTAEPTNFNCDFNKNTCITPAPDFPDMIENFMDFSSDDCKSTFTKGQINLMRYVIKNHRTQLPIKMVEVPKNKEALLYPNPTNGFLNAIITPNIDLPYQFVIRNLQQQIVDAPVESSLYNQNQHHRIDLSQQAPGIYIIEFLTNGQRAFSERVLVIK